MRLIDADALLNHEVEAYRMSTMLVVGKGYILDAPTIDAVPVVHGRWLNRPKTCVFICSVCGREARTFHTNNIEEAEREFPYCHCGAKMDLGKEG